MRIFLLAFLVTLGAAVHAQVDTVRPQKLKPLVISRKRIFTDAALTMVRLDTLVTQNYKLHSVSDLLQWHSNAFIKNYGVSNLSTVSIRGASAAQSQVLWHGINLNNAATGITDFSNLPVGLFESIRVGTLNNDQVGAQIQLENKEPTFLPHSKIRFGAGYNSIRSNQLLFDQQSGTKKWFIQNTLFIQSGTNRFRYSNPHLDTILYLENAQQQQFGVMSNGYRKVRNHTLSAHLWYQHQFRQIPPTIFELESKKHEITSGLRAVLEGHFYSRKQVEKLLLRMGIVQDRLFYNDSVLFVSSNSRVLNLPWHAGYTVWDKPHHRLHLIVSGSSSFLLQQSGAELHRTMMKLDYFIASKGLRWVLQAFAQQEYTNRFDLPLSAGLQVQRRLSLYSRLYFRWNKTYRAPNLNELFFNPGGNPYLKPEVGKNMELGFHGKQAIGKVSQTMDAAWFQRKVTNWIVWYGNTILSPRNIAMVHSRGIEVNYQGEYQLDPQPGNSKYSAQQRKPLRLNWGILYAYTLATTEKTDLPNDYSVGRQLPFVPRYQLKYSLGFRTSHTGIRYFRSYTGYRFTTTDESEYLPPFSTHNLMANHNFQTKQYRFTATVNLHNLLNVSYEGVPGRMLPGRNLQVGIIVEPRRERCCPNTL